MHTDTHTHTNMHTASHTFVYMHLCTHKLKHACTQMRSNLLNLTMNLSRHTHTNTTVEFMYAAEILTTLFVCGRYTKGSPNLLLSLYSQFMRSCSLILKGKQTILSSAVFLLLLFQTRRKQRGGCSNTGNRRPAQDIKPHPHAGGLIIDVKHTQIQCGFSAL